MVVLLLPGRLHSTLATNLTVQAAQTALLLAGPCKTWLAGRGAAGGTAERMGWHGHQRRGELGVRISGCHAFSWQPYAIALPSCRCC